MRRQLVVVFVVLTIVAVATNLSGPTMALEQGPISRTAHPPQTVDTSKLSEEATRKEASWTKRQNAHLCALGDSLTAGGHYNQLTGRYQETPYLSLLKSKYGGIPGFTKYSIFGYPGKNSEQILERAVRVVKDRRCDVALVMAGTNDVYTVSKSATEVIDTVGQIAKALSPPSHIIIIGLPRMNFTLLHKGEKAYCHGRESDVVEALRREVNEGLEQLGYRFFSTDTILHDADHLTLWSDCLHYSPRGYAALADFIRSQLLVLQ